MGSLAYIHSLVFNIPNYCYVGHIDIAGHIAGIDSMESVDDDSVGALYCCIRDFV